eukprot:gene6655-7355_t
MSNYVIRQATISDLSYIHELIVHSFDAMADCYGEEIRPHLRSQAEVLIGQDLNPEAFSHYLSHPDHRFWVIVDEENHRHPLGCVALKTLLPNTSPSVEQQRQQQRQQRQQHQQHCEEMELVRMAVSPLLRQGGLGTLLIHTLLKHCLDHHVHRVSLMTANPQAMKFYSKHGFHVVKSFTFPFSDSILIHGYKMVKYLGESLIRKVAVVGRQASSRSHVTVVEVAEEEEVEEEEEEVQLTLLVNSLSSCHIGKVIKIQDSQDIYTIRLAGYLIETMTTDDIRLVIDSNLPPNTIILEAGPLIRDGDGDDEVLAKSLSEMVERALDWLQQRNEVFAQSIAASPAGSRQFSSLHQLSIQDCPESLFTPNSFPVITAYRQVADIPCPSGMRLAGEVEDWTEATEGKLLFIPFDPQSNQEKVYFEREKYFHPPAEEQKSPNPIHPQQSKSLIWAYIPTKSSQEELSTGKKNDQTILLFQPEDILVY